MKLALATISYLITVFALVLLAIRVRQLIAMYKKQQPDPTRSNDKSVRFKNMLKEVLGHTKMLNFTGSGIAHWFVMIGFGALFGTLVTAYGQVIKPDFALPLIGHFVLYELFAEVIAALTGIGIITLIGIRQVTRFRMLNRFSGSGMGKAYYVEATILAIVFCVFALRGLEGALAGETQWNWHYAISWPAVLTFNSMSTASLESAIVVVAALKIVISMAWFIEIATNFLTLNQLMKVAERAGFYRDVVLVLGLCGLRWGELVGLQVKDLNVSAGTLTIRRSLVEINGKLEESTTKSHRWRIVHLPAILQSACHRWVFDKNQDDPLFHTQEGTFLRNTNFTRRVFIPALKAAEVKKIRIHDLRHTAASIAISAGATPNMVKEMLGHSDVQLTMRVYAHIFEADREKVAANVDRAVNEVHEMCTEPELGNSQVSNFEVESPSDLRFFLQTGKQVDFGTSDYESGALTN